MDINSIVRKLKSMIAASHDPVGSIDQALRDFEAAIRLDERSKYHEEMSQKIDWSNVK
jgi:hypothetical protein